MVVLCLNAPRSRFEYPGKYCPRQKMCHGTGLALQRCHGDFLPRDITSRGTETHNAYKGSIGSCEQMPILQSCSWEQICNIIYNLGWSPWVVWSQERVINAKHPVFKNHHDYSSNIVDCRNLCSFESLSTETICSIPNKTVIARSLDAVRNIQGPLHSPKGFARESGTVGTYFVISNGIIQCWQSTD